MCKCKCVSVCVCVCVYVCVCVCVCGYVCVCVCVCILFGHQRPIPQVDSGKCVFGLCVCYWCLVGSFDDQVKARVDVRRFLRLIWRRYGLGFFRFSAHP